jgi:uroporphyrinogen-III synthase
MSLPSSLTGKRIVITRPKAQAAALADKLAALGAEPIIFPTIQIAPVDDYAPLDAALGQLGQYQWIVFTSANAVAIFWERLGGHLPATVPVAAASPIWPAPLQFAAVGPATARALEKRGASAKFVPDEYVAEALAAGLGDVAGQRILLPHAELAREALAAELRRRGATVDEIAIYRTLPAAPDPAGLAELRRGVDAITFTSASAARNFALMAGGAAFAGSPAIVACIGPVTAAAARQSGLPVDVVAAEYTFDGLVAALAKHFGQAQQKEN